MTTFLQQARAGVQHLAPYQPGKPIEELQRELGLSRIVKLASNENPLGPSPKALIALQDTLSELSRYPDGNGFVLKSAIEHQFGWAQDRITLGNGSNDVLDLVARAFLGDGDEAIYAEHAFAVYAIAIQAVGARGIVVPARQYGHDLPAMAAAITPATKVVFLANPNNPTGTWFERADFAAFMAAVPERVVVVLDEAYGEFVMAPDALNGFDVLDQHPNLIVTRTLAKAYGLAALRVGYAVSCAEIANIINRVRQPFNVNTMALVAAAAALSDSEFVARSRAVNEAGKAQWLAGLAELGLSAIPSRGNFLCVDMKQEAQPLFQALLKEGVIVRPVGNYGLPQHLRISIGLAEENEFALAALGRVLAVSKTPVQAHSGVLA